MPAPTEHPKPKGSAKTFKPLENEDIETNLKPKAKARGRPKLNKTEDVPMIREATPEPKPKTQGRPKKRKASPHEEQKAKV